MINAQPIPNANESFGMPNKMTSNHVRCILRFLLFCFPFCCESRSLTKSKWKVKQLCVVHNLESHKQNQLEVNEN